MSGTASTNGRQPDANSSRASVLVTGAAGFIGSHLCDRLVDEGYQVWGLDSFNDSYDPARKRENLAEALEHPSMHLVEGDVRDQVLLDGLMSDVEFDAVVHLAARPDEWISAENREQTLDVNLHGTLAVLEAMARQEVPVLLFGSSSSVYGDGSAGTQEEDARADRPLSPFAASKRAGEMLCHTYHHLHDLSVYCFRMFTVFGPRQRPTTALYRLLRPLVHGETRDRSRDGLEPQDYVHVSDVVDALMLALDRGRNLQGDGPEFEIVNLGRGEAVDGRELSEILSRLLPDISMPDLSSHDGRSEGPDRAVASIQRSSELFGYDPSVTLSTGLRELVEWLQASRSDVAAEEGPTATARRPR